ncbi:PREDICTED: uncharacterized protein LOC105568151 [Vollenhovia emeryi]|uniref:uncharacterized protein LOC105568151 n=1 Tax=Vollenhovia emeryi TaxID=411798 RepID=UPI0005F3DA44|nr:PREDICTED: uncharacterized protein LOC105568151 [Vollenhovia emeryi]
MARRHIISAAFLMLVSANMIQGAAIVETAPSFFHESTFPNFVNLVGLPRIGELSHNAASSAASAASSAVNGFKTYVDNFRTGLAQHIQVPPSYPILHRFVHGDIWPSYGGPATGIVSDGVIAPRFSRRYGAKNGAASAASSAASGHAV